MPRPSRPDNLPDITSAWRALPAGALVACCLAVAGGAHADTTEAGAAPLPEPFSAAYRARYGSFPISASAERSLERRGPHWVFTSRIDAGIFSLTQESVLDGDTGLRSHRYHYRQRGIAGRRDRDIAFDRAAGLIRRSGDKVRQHPLEEPAWDPLGWQLALRQDLLRDHPVPAAGYSYRVSDGGSYENYRFETADRGPLEVPAGTFDALHLERRLSADDDRPIRLWLAPAHDYLLLRLELVDEDGRALSVALTGLGDAPAGEGGP